MTELNRERISFTELFDADPIDADELQDELLWSIERLGLEFSDSYRATPETKGIDEHVKKQTCCGVWEGRHTCKSGKTYFIGCNYGH